MKRDVFQTTRRSSQAKLLDKEVREIRRMYQGGRWSLARLAERHEVTQQTIRRVIDRETYADVT